MTTNTLANTQPALSYLQQARLKTTALKTWEQPYTIVQTEPVWKYGRVSIELDLLEDDTDSGPSL